MVWSKCVHKGSSKYFKCSWRPGARLPPMGSEWIIGRKNRCSVSWQLSPISSSPGNLKLIHQLRLAPCLRWPRPSWHHSLSNYTHCCSLHKTTRIAVIVVTKQFHFKLELGFLRRITLGKVSVNIIFLINYQIVHLCRLLYPMRSLPVYDICTPLFWDPNFVWKHWTRCRNVVHSEK